MNLASYRLHNQIALGLVEGDTISRISGRIPGITDNMLQLIEQWAGDRVCVEIDGIGAIENEVVEEVTR